MSALLDTITSMGHGFREKVDQGTTLFSTQDLMQRVDSMDWEESLDSPIMDSMDSAEFRPEDYDFAPGHCVLGHGSTGTVYRIEHFYRLKVLYNRADLTATFHKLPSR